MGETYNKYLSCSFVIASFCRSKSKKLDGSGVAEGSSSGS